jgi:protein farnesyltransferase/geranylgeranyltransferase type-1 subunit alpha
MIQDDPRNNSAWNQRWFAVHRAVKEPLTLELCRHEADYAIHTGATLDPFNESPWRYLIGLLREQSSCDHSDLLYSEYYTKTESLRSVLADAHRDPETCANWTSARIDLLEGMGDKESLLDKAIPLAEGLAREYDPIRKKYWMMRVDQMKEKAAAAL